jgi:hypothetical protein
MRVVERHLIHRDWPTCQSDSNERMEVTHVNDRVEVTESITGELTKDGDHENLSHSPSTIVVVKQRSVCPSVLSLKVKRRNDIQSHQVLSIPSCRIPSLISAICKETSLLSLFPFPWYLVKKACASSSRPFAIKNRGDSGMKKTETMTMTQANDCRIRGTCQDRFELIKLHP